MDRREFFQTSIIAALAAKVLGDTPAAWGQAAAPRHAGGRSPPRRRRRAS